MAPKVPTVRLNNGLEMPVLGLGTYMVRSTGNKASVKMAIDEGYRHIDTAYFYQNESQVGKAVRDKIAEGVIKREDVFIVTKVWNTYHAPEHVEQAFQKSLDNLGLDYIDLYLVHWPTGWKFSGWTPDDFLPMDAEGKTINSDVDYLDTWKAMEKLMKTGKVKSIGVSNFNSEQMTRLLANCTIKPVTNQVECNPGINQRKLIDFCRKHDIVITAYSPLGRPNLTDPVVGTEGIPKHALDDPRVVEIGKRYGKSSGQVVLRYLIELGTIPIPKSSRLERIRQNIDLFDFKLTPEEIKVMDGFNTGGRTVPFNFSREHKYFPFNLEY
ncbi:1,5-anhydro-D-fructose reductase isoform X2 [Anopheles ziemanni]|uniref:1,5-anhydro-D-fructose reductase isoform X2 n=1 Tax=Anopheles coustani TaxID=139045 RepID=UPI00265A7F4F|nr:1,5-anhydro-D-fructose reductase isoform X2 [Anopheles coustani]XP_058172955.1 1,5-anhydro-D-fructose reductase isoform X2 [Anopheles ziemanni]